MIKKIIHTSDLHIRNIKRHEEYKIQFSKFIDSCKDIASNYKYDEVRILIAGDLFHQKIQTSNEQTEMLSWLLKELEKIAPVVIIAGNHDFMESNSDRMDSLTPIVKLLDLNNLKYLDMTLEYKSGIVVDDNIVWCLYSIFDNYRNPDVKLEKINYPDKKLIGLFHGPLSGSKTDVGFEFSSGASTDIFDGCDVVMCGDIHKRSELIGPDGIKVVYPSSMIQQDFGESVSSHGFMLWDVDSLEYEEHNIDNDYGFYKFKITSVEDVENQIEEFVNF
jgi:DNA repair exonuclease SbcCD nuclease subunit